MKKIYFVAIAFAIIFGAVLVASALYGGTIVVQKNGLNNGPGAKPTFSKTESFRYFIGKRVCCENPGSETTKNAMLTEPESESFAIDYAHTQIEAGILKGTKYLDEHNQYVKWQSESKDLSVANWVKTWSIIEFEPEDPKY